MLSIKNLLTGDVNRLRYTMRFSTCRLVRAQNVAEHSYYVTLYALFLAQWYTMKYGKTLDNAKLLWRALLHDVEEARTGDCPRTFKHSDLRLSKVLKEAATVQAAWLLGGLFEDRTDADSFLVTANVQTWIDAKDATVEGTIVEIADYLECVAYLLEEMQASNRTLTQHTAVLTEYMQFFRAPVFNEFRALLSEVERLVTKIVGGAE